MYFLERNKDTRKNTNKNITKEKYRKQFQEQEKQKKLELDLKLRTLIMIEDNKKHRYKLNKEMSKLQYIYLKTYCGITP